MKLFYFAFLISAAVSASEERRLGEDSHDHSSHSDKDSGDEHPCACEAEELGFEIDCTKSDLLLTTLADLIKEDCSKDCTSDSCFKNFMIVQSHYDFCLQEEVFFEDAFHEFEGVCEHCAISRKRNFDLTDCPIAECDSRGDTAYEVLLTENCLADCSTNVCGENYQILRTEHDNCEHDTLSESAETGIHDFENVCGKFNCNSLLTDSSVAEQLVCTEEMKMKLDDGSNAVAAKVSGFLAALSGVALLVNH